MLILQTFITTLLIQENERWKSQYPILYKRSKLQVHNIK